jgi:hypothetical protein
MTTIDISNIAKENHGYAVHLATHHNILTYKNGIFILDKVPKQDPFQSVDFWRDISLAAEILLKSCLLKYHISFFKKRAHGEYGSKVTASSNIWLQATLKTLQIDYIAQINTGTISTAIRSAEELLFVMQYRALQAYLTVEEKVFLPQTFQYFPDWGRKNGYSCCAVCG